MRGDKRSHGLWEISAPPPPPTSVLEGDMDVDVAIIGAGFTGLSAALHLAEAKISVAVVEAVEIGFGGSGRNVGLVNAGMWIMPNLIVETLGPEFGQRLLDLLGNAPGVVFEIVEKHNIACEIERNGTLHCAVGKSGLEELAERERQWLARGAPVQLLNAQRTTEMTGTGAYAGSLLDNRAGTLQPLAYARGLASAAIAAGALIFTSTPVATVRDEGKAWRLQSPKGSVRAHSVIVATNAYDSSPWPQIRSELTRLPYFNFATEPLSDTIRETILPGKQGAWDTNTILSSFRLDQMGRLIFGSVGAIRGLGASIHRDWARRALAKLFPHLKDVVFQAEWYGMIGMTENNLPRLHRLARDTWSISGYNGRGIAPGTVFGRCLARLVAGLENEKSLPLPVSAVQPSSFVPLKEAYYEVGAQVAHFTGARF